MSLRFRLLGAAALLAGSAAAQVPTERGFVPPDGFVPETAGQAAYACDPATVGANGRCASTTGPKASWDRNGAFRPQLLVLTFDDCITPGSERYVRSLFDGSLRNPDGRPVPLTYFVSLENCPATGDGVYKTDERLVKARYDRGDEMAVHTRSHQTGSTTTYAQWVAEMNAVRDYFKALGLGADAGRGFRAPYLASNPAMFRALHDLGFLYDSSVLEAPFWSPVSKGTSQYTWPFTYDQYDPAAKPQLCEGWAPGNDCPDRALPGLWQIPLYYFVRGTQANPTYLGTMDLGNVDYSGYNTPITGNTLLNDLRTHRNARLGGNRAPMTLFFHANGFSDPNRVAVYKQFLQETLRRGDVWAVTMQGLVEWMKAPVSFFEMRSWYASYCTRHACAAPYSAGDELAADLPAVDAPTTALAVFPNPARERATASVETAGAGARLSVHDVLGREVFAATLDAPGRHRVALPLAGAAAGVYAVRVSETDGRTQQTTLVVQ